MGNNPDRQSIYSAALGLYNYRIIRLINKKHRLKSAVIIDELPTVSIRGLDNLIATARSNKVAVCLGFQDFSQLECDYGEKEAKVIQNTVGNLFVGQVVGDTARTLPRSTPQLEILACVVGAAGFAYLFGGTLADMPVAAVAGLLEALVCQQFARHGINRIFTDIVAAFCGTIWAIAVQTVVPAVNANAAIIGALMVLTPGVALTMGVRDILNGDYLSGSIRLLDALLIAGSIAGGVVLGWIMARGLGVA